MFCPQSADHQPETETNVFHILNNRIKRHMMHLLVNLMKDYLSFFSPRQDDDDHDLCCLKHQK